MALYFGFRYILQNATSALVSAFPVESEPHLAIVNTTPARHWDQTHTSGMDPTRYRRKLNMCLYEEN